MMQGQTMLWLIQQERNREIAAADRVRELDSSGGRSTVGGNGRVGRALVMVGLGFVRLGMSSAFRR